MNQSKNSTPKIAIPKTADGCSPTITSSFGAGISIANLLGVDHFPKGGGIDNQKVTSMKLLINSDVDGLSRTIRAGYYKAGFANYIHKDGRAADQSLFHQGYLPYSLF